MCSSKKWVGGLAALVLLIVGGFVVMGTPLGSWIEVQWDKVGAFFQKQVSPEDQLAAISKDIQKLDEEIDVKYDEKLAKEREIDRTDKALAPLRKDVEEQWKVIKVLQTGIEDARKHDSDTVTFEGKSSKLAVARQDLTNCWDKFKRSKATLDAKETQLQAQKDHLAAIKETHSEMLKAKAECESQLEQLKAQLEQLRTEQAKGAAGAESDAYKTRMTGIRESLGKVGDQISTQSAKAKEQTSRLAKDQTGAGQMVKNDATEAEIRKFEAEKDKLLTSDK